MRKPFARADLVTAAALLAFAAAVLEEAWRMPRFTETGGDVFTAPGIVPGFYAVVIGLLALALAVRALGDGALRRGPAEPDPEATPQSLRRMFMAAGLGLVFIVGLVGAMPFWLAATLYIAAFIIVFEWRPGLSAAARARTLIAPVVIGLATGFAVTVVFEKIFLVQLP
ncbi:MAG: tripartite tricarboxylate transporter TctB family protein [Rhodospirillales bacterium]|nr:tripartite tricarboxylate transporter TctB family protein [Rhodospirillales bacterium]